MPGPLEGIKVVDLSQVVAGPVCTMLLADQGADVVKVEFPDAGDILRHNRHYAKNDINALALNCNRGKLSLALDMATQKGLDLLLELTADADVFIQNFRGGVIERLGITHEALRDANPKLITVWMSGYGQTGPWADVPVFDPVIQAVSGHCAVQVNPQVPFPDVHRTIIIDKSTALTAAQAITAALFARERSAHGRGQHIELNMLDTALYFFWPDGGMAHTLLDDEGVSPGSTLYEGMSITNCSDGSLVFYVASEDNFKGLFRAIGRDGWADDPTYFSSAGRACKPEVLVEIASGIEEGFYALETAEALRRLRANDVPHGPVLGVEHVHEFEQTVHNGSMHEWNHPKAGQVRQPRPPARFSETSVEPRWWMSDLGENSVEVLRSLGRSDDEIAALKVSGVIS